MGGVPRLEPAEAGSSPARVGPSGASVGVSQASPWTEEAPTGAEDRGPAESRLDSQVAQAQRIEQMISPIQYWPGAALLPPPNGRVVTAGADPRVRIAAGQGGVLVPGCGEGRK